LPLTKSSERVFQTFFLSWIRTSKRIFQTIFQIYTRKNLKTHPELLVQGQNWKLGGGGRENSLHNSFRAIAISSAKHTNIQFTLLCQKIKKTIHFIGRN
jgi:hypothetical protein